MSLLVAHAGDVFGSYNYLCEYETERSRHNLPTALTIDGIQQLYSTNLDLVVLARSLGVQVSVLQTFFFFVIGGRAK
jgi:ubiquinone biosynthesis monooxygenase Coq6